MLSKELARKTKGHANKIVIPKHKRFVYSSAGLSGLDVGVIQESRIWLEIERRLSSEEIVDPSASSVEEIFERTFRYATKFEGWLDADWRTD